MQKKKKNWIVIGVAVAGTLALGAGVVARMNGPGTGKTPAFLPGIYTCLAQNEFCRIMDTLVIRRTKTEEDDYAVTRGTSFVRIRQGKEGQPEYEQQHWTMHYEAKKFRMLSADEGDTVRFYPEANRVSKADFYYEKIE